MILHLAPSKCPGLLSKPNFGKSSWHWLPLLLLLSVLSPLHLVSSNASQRRKSHHWSHRWLASSGHFQVSILPDQICYLLPLQNSHFSWLLQNTFSCFSPCLSGSFWILFLSGLYSYNGAHLRSCSQSPHPQPSTHTASMLATLPIYRSSSPPRSRLLHTAAC